MSKRNKNRRKVGVVRAKLREIGYGIFRTRDLQDSHLSLLEVRPIDQAQLTFDWVEEDFSSDSRERVSEI